MDSLLCVKVENFIYQCKDLYIYLFNTDDVHRLSLAAVQVNARSPRPSAMRLYWSWIITQTFTIEHNVHFVYLI